MNPRTTGILFLVALGLAAFVYLYEIRGGEQRSEAEARAKQIFPDVEASSVEWIALRTTDRVDARFERVEDGWRMREPVDFLGDRTALEGIADALASLTSQSVYDDPQPLDVYGLGDGAQEIGFGAEGEEHQLRIGAKTPVGANHYVNAAGSELVYTVESFSVNRFDRSADDLRDRRPLHFDREAIDQIEVQWEGGGVRLERDGDRWTLQSPLESAVDQVALDGFLSELAFLRAEGFVDDPSEADLARLDPPAYRVLLTGAAAEEDGEPLRHELQIGGLLDASARLTRGAENSLYRIGQDRFGALPRRVVDFRFKELTSFLAADAVRFEIEFHDSSATGSTTVQTITGELGDAGWTTEPVSMRAGSAGALVGALAGLAAEDIPAESMGPEELAGVGLAPAQVSVRVYGAAGDGDEPTLLGAVVLGSVQGDRLFARVPDRNTIYLVDYALAEDVPINVEAFENRFVSQEGVEGDQADVPTAAEADVPTAAEADVPTAAEADVPTAAEADVPTAAEADVPTAPEAAGEAIP